MQMEEKESKVIVDKSTAIRKEWEAWARRGNWGVRGYSIVRAPCGPGKIEETQMGEFMLIDRPHGALYKHSYGLVSKFFTGLIDKRLWGTKCPKCGTTYCPPRAHCWNPACKVAITEWVELPLKGRIHTFSVMLFSADAFLEKLPFVLAYVQVEGTDTAIPMQIETDPTNVFIGQKLEIRFREERKGELMDMYGVPSEGQTIPANSCLNNPEYIKDLENDLEKTYKYLEKRFGLKKEDVEKRWKNP
jgi:uncharacterized OB-fold protein